MIEELIGMAREFVKAIHEGRDQGFNEEEKAFDDALADNASARDVMRGSTLKLIARELADRIKAKASLDWTQRETVRADMRRTIRGNSSCVPPVTRVRMSPNCGSVGATRREVFLHATALLRSPCARTGRRRVRSDADGGTKESVVVHDAVFVFNAGIIMDDYTVTVGGNHRVFVDNAIPQAVGGRPPDHHAGQRRGVLDSSRHGWGETYHCEATASAGVLHARTTGRRPFLRTRVNAPAGELELTIRARLTHPIAARLYWYRTSLTPVPETGDQSQHFELGASGDGWKEYKVRITATTSFQVLRLDLGDAADRTVEIDSVVLRQGTPK